MDQKPFERGTSLSIFVSDRYEDIGALVAALVIALGVLFFVGK
ncbi:MAG: hypothetical protein Q7U97_14815 [Rhodocyclaceae bacterium]|jgi:hypothetical protein|nr:hypothetical protein [Rhodocyclaceae bacterium]